MGCRIINGTKDGGYCTAAVFYCSTTDIAFGPVMEDADEAELFLAFLKVDPRSLSELELEEEYSKFRKESQHVSSESQARSEDQDRG